MLLLLLILVGSLLIITSAKEGYVFTCARWLDYQQYYNKTRERISLRLGFSLFLYRKSYERNLGNKKLSCDWVFWWILYLTFLKWHLWWLYITALHPVEYCVDLSLEYHGLNILCKGCFWVHSLFGSYNDGIIHILYTHHTIHTIVCAAVQHSQLTR